MNLRHPAVLVFAGAALGGAVRIGADELIPHATSGIPWTIIAINVIGSAALGWVTGFVQVAGHSGWLPLVGPGFFGGFTTFSAISALMWTGPQGLLGSLAILAVTALTAFLAALAGVEAGERRALTREAPA